MGEHLLSLFQEFDSFPFSEHLSEVKALLNEANAMTLVSSGWLKLKEILNLNKEVRIRF